MTATAKRKRYLRNKAFKLLREVCLKREPKCVVCGKMGYDGHHFIPRSLCQHLQLDLDNLVTLCRADHIALEWRKDPEITNRIIEARPKNWATELYKKRREVQPSIWSVQYLEAKVEELQKILTTLPTT